MNFPYLLSMFKLPSKYFELFPAFASLLILLFQPNSAEKLRPEKELDRAKSEILHCKFKIRELFRYLDSLSSEGRFEASLFDSEGQIDSEDVCKSLTIPK